MLARMAAKLSVKIALNCTSNRCLRSCFANFAFAAAGTYRRRAIQPSTRACPFANGHPALRQFRTVRSATPYFSANSAFVLSVCRCRRVRRSSQRKKNVQQDAVLLVGDPRLTRGHAKNRQQHAFDGVPPRRRADSAGELAAPRFTVNDGCISARMVAHRDATIRRNTDAFFFPSPDTPA